MYKYFVLLFLASPISARPFEFQLDGKCAKIKTSKRSEDVSFLHLEIDFEEVTCDSSKIQNSLEASSDSFESWVHSFTPLDQKGLLDRQESIIQTFSPEGSNLKQYKYFKQYYLPNIVRTAGIDKYLFNIHNTKFSNKFIIESGLAHTGAEFEAYILKKNSNSHKAVGRIIFASQFIEDSPGIGPTAFEESKNFFKLKTDEALDQGFTIAVHIHSHPFSPLKNDIGGTLMPSGCSMYGDISAFKFMAKNLNLRNVWITNGIDTVMIDLQSPNYHKLTKIKDVEANCL